MTGETQRETTTKEIGFLTCYDSDVVHGGEQGGCGTMQYSNWEQVVNKLALRASSLPKLESPECPWKSTWSLRFTESRSLSSVKMLQRNRGVGVCLVTRETSACLKDRSRFSLWMDQQSLHRTSESHELELPKEVNENRRTFIVRCSPERHRPPPPLTSSSLFFLFRALLSPLDWLFFLSFAVVHLSFSAPF